MRSPPGLKRGSPPRVRGKVAQKGAFDVRLGITPARAGKRSPIAKSPHHAGDHPRACGEKDPGDRVAFTDPGSPPRVRGKAGQLLNIGSQIGITPARAGKSMISGKGLLT